MCAPDFLLQAKALWRGSALLAILFCPMCGLWLSENSGVPMGRNSN